ncbi:VOC family protein [Pengzhenrongella sicca]|uniref:VOC family protein n=1 Tax=Pengzhenrongella sicca TaxID=2819238 RepID=A0A8A4ZCK0_9MICO|nr:VOC family protein [Pengzhenrongella sicca]QTE29614.1 VOC family protein [Pengzhenrongella sicca]
MIHATAWPQGTPSWVDLSVPDRVAAQEFYGPLLGWDFAVGGPETGFYTMALKHGQPVAGIGEPPPGAEGQPAAWTTYLAVDDVEAVTAKASEAGGTVVAPPMTIEDFGRMAVVVDPTGAVVGLWESGAHTGANLVNEPGSMIWNEALSHDLAAARAFYGTVFGYAFEDMSAPGFEYVTVNVDGKSVGGLGGVGALPADAPPHWETYFAVTDTDAATARAVELGATVLDGPIDSPYGRLAVLRGPAGEQFTLMSTDEPESAEAAG